MREKLKLFILSGLFFGSQPLYAAEGAYTWLTFFTHNSKYHHVVASLLILCVILLLGVYVQLNKAKIKGDLGGKLDLLNFMEVFTEFVYKMIEGIIPKGGKIYLPLIGTIILYILISNLSSFIPGFISPSTSISNNLAMGLTTFIFYNYCGFKEHGVGYLKQFAGPVLLLAPFMFVLELISHALRPISLSLRLFGNINGDHTVLSIFSGLTPLFVPVIFLGLGLLVCIIQTYIFSVLSTVYISLATSHDH